MTVRTTSGTAARRAATGRGRTGTPTGLTGLAGRAAAELERLRPRMHHPRRSRHESVLERVKHLV